MGIGKRPKNHPSDGRLQRPMILIAGLVLAAFLVACGGGGKSSSADSATEATSAERSTTTSPASTSSSTTTTQPATPTTPISIPSGKNATGPDGSGCSPAGDILSDGIWFGNLVSVDTPGNAIGLDLECFYSGAAANAASAAQGGTGQVPNGVFISNQSSKIFTIPTWANVQVLPLEMVGSGGFTGGNQRASTGVAAANTILTMRAPKIVWVQIVGGKALVIQSQFTP